MLTPGDVLSGRYRLDAPIASGGMGEVWRATDTTLSRTVALKMLRAERIDNSDFDARFRAEARTMAALHHPNVVNIYDYGRSPLADGTSASYLVMTYVDGDSLRDRLVKDGPLPVAETMTVLAQAADALHAVHRQGIVHRDVKPANLLVQADGTVTLVDFGVARTDALTSVTTANAIIGTALYMAPEQAAGRKVSPATDIYSLGAVAFHCLAGTPPFNGETALEVALHHVSDEPPPLPESVPVAARALVARALAKDPADRFPDAAAFAAAARAAAADPHAVPEGTGPLATAVLAPGSAALRPLPGSLAAGGAAAAAAGSAGPATTLTGAEPGGGGAPRPGHRRRLAILSAAGAVVLIGLVGLTVLLTNQQSTPASPIHLPSASPTPSASATVAAEPTGSRPTRPAIVGFSTPPSAGVPSSVAPSAAATASPSVAPTSAAPTDTGPADQPSSPPSTPADTPTGAPSAGDDPAQK